ncbi:MAG TPA: excinuclease ABC subunit UvrA [Candidatus Fimenecus excrementigallinarum]|uniref:UvrABC system protein A n=1 Tax=Candidatus Fimenecus excrementigallinarum TaxID=2840816 RepID=A0A9D1LEL3_9FIRM|nr:excinuclease ABC subunit UvrA [Candidatus Fimenecus excrementigallinarum]
MASQYIVVKGAREHNLKNIDVQIPRDKLVVLTGLSGSGKSSLAFDTIYAEGQRRYVESLSSYARMFLGQMEKPNVDSIEGLSPAISIDQKTTSRNPRSTVGTVTEIYDYLRLLYARVGVPHCPVCGREIVRQSVDTIVDRVLELPAGSKVQILAPVVRARKGEHQKELDAARRAGFVRVRVDGSLYDLSEEIKLEKNFKHSIEIVVDRLVIGPDIRSRLADSIETATALTGGTVLVNLLDGEDLLFSQNYACPEHGASVDELTPRMFSFNNPFGACETCTGLGTFLKVDPDLIIPNKKLSIRAGAIRASGWSNAEGGTIAQMYYEALGEQYGFTLDTPLCDFSKAALDALLYGTKGKKLTVHRKNVYGKGTYEAPFEGIVPNMERRYRESTSDWARWEIEQVMKACDCPDCHGARLKPIVLGVTVGGINIYAFTQMSVTAALRFLDGLELRERDRAIADQILREIRSRLEFLASVGLDYLTLARSSGTLSGGESQRIRLATQIGSSLMGVLYILDEPSIGLHQRDNDKLLATLKRLRDLGNTLLVVEHDEDTMYAADYIVDVGPGAGVHGGEVVCAGTVEDIKACPQSVTGQYLSGKRRIPVPEKRRKGSGKFLTVRGAAENNLKNINVKFPLGKFIAVTGVSGSGKSSLVNEILYKRLANELNGAKKPMGRHKDILGLENLDKVVDIDQSPIGRTPRSNPATYTGVFTDIRSLFAQTQDAKVRGFSPSRFSFNVKGGRCEACQGDGIVKIEMHFLADVYVPCEVCKGARFNRETLEVKYKGKSIYDVLEMTVEEALDFFSSIPKIARKLQTIYDVGLGYVKLGQPATTLSGGEAQRVKLATELSKRPTGRTIYILDEPTTGLHTADVHKLIDVLQKLADGGNTVVVIEHNLDVIKVADHIIDLGPEGGDNGGTIVAEGTPEQVARCAASYTGQYLKPLLEKQAPKAKK